MLSSVLRTPRAIAVNIEVIRALVRLRELLATDKELAEKLRVLEHKLTEHDTAIEEILLALGALFRKPAVPAKRPLGFVYPEGPDTDCMLTEILAASPDFSYIGVNDLCQYVEAIMKAAALFCSLLWCGAVLGQVPDSGRWQELRFGGEAVAELAADRYIEQVVALAAAGRLDRDKALLRRVQAISAGLVAAAVELKPEAAQWQWEVHVASGAEVEASCEAGGKLLVGVDFVRRLALDDGELAVLLAHEVAHAIAEHHRETYSEAQLLGRPLVPLDVVMERLDTDLSMQVRLAWLSRMQEREADQLGMVIAHRAGWQAAAMPGFYRKLADDAARPASGFPGGEAIVGSHPPLASRISMARGMARLLAAP